MKVLLILLLLAGNAVAEDCKNKIAESEIAAAIAGNTGAGQKPCTESGVDKCVCFDGILWQSADYKDGILSNDELKLNTYLANDVAAKTVKATKQVRRIELTEKVKLETITKEELDELIKLIILLDAGLI